MRHVGNCPACGDKADWLSDKITDGVEVVLGVSRRIVVATDLQGNYLVEVLSLHNQPPIVHATFFVNKACYIWSLDDVRFLPGDLPIQIYDYYDTDEDFT